MKIGSEYHEFGENELAVLQFLKNLKQSAPENFDYLNYYGVPARVMIKFMEHPEKYGDHDFGYVCSLFDAIRKTYRHYVMERPS